MSTDDVLFTEPTTGQALTFDEMVSLRDWIDDQLRQRSSEEASWSERQVRDVAQWPVVGIMLCGKCGHHEIHSVFSPHPLSEFVIAVEEHAGECHELEGQLGDAPGVQGTPEAPTPGDA